MHLALNGWFWNRPNSGSGQYTRYLTYYLNRLVSDLDISLICPTSEGKPQDVPPSVRVEMVQNRTGHVGKVLFEQKLFPKTCGTIGATIAHVPYWGSPLSSPIPVVVTVHDLTTELVREYRRGLKARAYNALVAASARGAAHIITDSLASKQDVIELLGVSAEKITPIYLAVDHSKYNTDTNTILDMAVKQQYGLDDFYTLYLGGYEIHKNIVTLLEAWAYVSTALGDDYPLLLAGKKPSKISERFPDYDAIIEQLDLGDSVRWIGYVEEEHKPTVYREAMAFVFPSSAEGFGLPPLEAMACGTPVVTTNAKSLPEVVGDAGFTVAPDNARRMAGALIAAIDNDTLNAELRSKGLAQAQKFKWETTAHETLLVYDRVLREEK